MAGTEDYSFYCSIENSPFWIRKTDETAAGGRDDDEKNKVNEWERKLIAPPKYSNRKLLYFSIVILLASRLLIAIFSQHVPRFLLNTDKIFFTLYVDSDVVDHRQLINPGIGMVRTAAENLLSHPFLVLRRSCQV
jgi:hypothetical protein